MKVGIMQPYFLPYLGYFQLIQEVDKFVIYDNIQFSKGWVSHNRFYNAQGKVEKFSLQLKKDSDYLDFNQRFLAESWFSDERQKLLRKFKEAYRKASGFHDNYETLEKIILNDETNLFEFNFSSIKNICEYLDIKTEIIKSSTLNIDTTLKAQDRVIASTLALRATAYVNPPGGVDLYSQTEFSKNNLSLNFIKPDLLPYKQGNYPWEAGLSILDVLLYNPKNKVKEMIQHYTIFNKINE